MGKVGSCRSFVAAVGNSHIEFVWTIRHQAGRMRSCVVGVGVGVGVGEGVGGGAVGGSILWGASIYYIYILQVVKKTRGPFWEMRFCKLKKNAEKKTRGPSSDVLNENLKGIRRKLLSKGVFLKTFEVILDHLDFASKKKKRGKKNAGTQKVFPAFFCFYCLQYRYRGMAVGILGAHEHAGADEEGDRVLEGLLGGGFVRVQLAVEIPVREVGGGTRVACTR